MSARQKVLVGGFTIFLALLFSPPKIFAQVVINEFLPNPTTGPDWVELYNVTDQGVYLNGWILDDEGTTTNMVDIKEATISAKGFLVFDVGSRLNKGGDTIYLKNNQGVTVDERSYTSDPGDNISLGRMPDGDEWGICQTLTKGSPNSCVLPTPSPLPTNTLAPTNTPVPEPTNTPAATSTPKPPTSTPTPKPTLKPTATATASGEILGSEESSTAAFFPWEATEGAESASPSGSSSPNRWLPLILMGVGFILLFSAAFWLWYTQLRK